MVYTPEREKRWGDIAWRNTKREESKRRNSKRMGQEEHGQEEYGWTDRKTTNLIGPRTGAIKQNRGRGAPTKQD